MSLSDGSGGQAGGGAKQRGGGAKQRGRRGVIGQAGEEGRGQTGDEDGEGV